MTLPSGTATLLFTDIEDSSRLWDTNRSDMAIALTRHNEILKAAIDEAGGHVVKDKGDGFFAVFADAVAAIRCVTSSQRTLLSAGWPEPIGEIRVRMALHTGSVEPQDGDYHGPPVNKVARIEGLAHGGQILMSDATRAVVQDELLLM